MVTITINTDSAAIVNEGEFEIARILRELAEDIASGKVEESCKLYDSNGNHVGEFQFDIEPEEEQ